MATTQLCHNISITGTLPYAIHLPTSETVFPRKALQANLSVKQVRQGTEAQNSKHPEALNCSTTFAVTSTVSRINLTLPELANPKSGIGALHQVSAAPDLDEEASSQTYDKLQQLDSGTSSAVSSEAFAPVRDGVAVLSSAHPQSVTISFATWSELVKHAATAAADIEQWLHLLTSAAPRLEYAFQKPQPLATCPIPSAAKEVASNASDNRLPEIWQQDELVGLQKGEQPMHEAAQPFHPVLLLIIVTASFVLGSLAHSMSKLLQTSSSPSAAMCISCSIPSGPRPRFHSQASTAKPLWHKFGPAEDK